MIGISFREIGGGSIAKLSIHTGFFKLVVQRISFAQVVRITELTNQVGGPH